jgi:hypothetical protein
MLLVGAPGWSGERGRVDIAFEGDELSAPESCNATPTSTPEPTATLTPTPTSTYTFTSVASATATFTSIATVTPTVTITLTVEPTSSATPRPATTVTPSVTGDATPGGSGGVITDATPTPIVVFPGAQGLPTPEVSQAGDTLIVRLPPVTPELPASVQKRALRSVMKRNRKLSRKQAQELLADPNNLAVTYIVYISKVEEARLSRFSLIESAHAAPKTRNLRERIRKLRARKNAVAITRIQPGASYRVYYEAEIALKKPRMVVGKTKPSGSTVFRTS